MGKQVTTVEAMIFIQRRKCYLSEAENCVYILSDCGKACVFEGEM